MTDLEKFFDDKEKTLTAVRDLMRDTSALDSIFASKTLYTEKDQTLITVVHFKCSGLLKEALQQHFDSKFCSIGRDYGDAVAVLGKEKQFSESEKEILARFGLYLEEISTFPTFGNN